MLKRHYTSEELARILYDSRVPIGLSWIGVHAATRDDYMRWISDWGTRRVAEKLADRLELRGDSGANGWLAERDKRNGTSPAEVQAYRIQEMMREMPEEQKKALNEALSPANAPEKFRTKTALDAHYEDALHTIAAQQREIDLLTEKISAAREFATQQLQGRELDAFLIILDRKAVEV